MRRAARAVLLGVALVAGHSATMRRFLALLAALVLTACAAGKVDVQPATQVQKLPDDLRVEFWKEGRSISGYMYIRVGRMPTRMQLRVEGVDAAGKIVTVTRWWIPDIPPNGRAFFQVTVPDAPAYRIIVESFNWHKGN